VAQKYDLEYTYENGVWYCESERLKEIGHGQTAQEARSMFIVANSLDWTDFAKQDADDVFAVAAHAHQNFQSLDASQNVRDSAFLMWFEATFCK